MATAKPDFSIKAHDRLPIIRAQLTTDEDVPQVIDLTGASGVDFIMRDTIPGSPTLPGSTVVVNSPANVVDAVNGIVEYAWLAVDTALPGNYLGEWEVTWISNARKQTFPTRSYHTIEIVADLDGS